MSSGPDLLGAVVGSEGTLGIVTEITVRLSPIPEAVETLLAVFGDVVSACRAVGRIIRSGLVPAAMEIVDRRTIEAVEASVYAAGLPRDAGAVLIVELDGVAPKPSRGRSREFARSPSSSGPGESTSRATPPSATVSGARARAPSARWVASRRISTSTTPWCRARKLPEVLERICAIADAHGLRLSNVFHAGDGNLHPNISFDRRDARELEHVMAAGQEILATCVAAGGVISGEHGIGVEKREYMKLVYSDADLEAMCRLRGAFDPDGVCNPGKIFPTTRFCIEANPKARGYERVAL